MKRFLALIAAFFFLCSSVSAVELDGSSSAEQTSEVVSEIEAITIKKEEVTKNKKTKKQIYAHPRTNFILATYYKGTGLEEVTKKLEEYLDNADKSESNINCI